VSQLLNLLNEMRRRPLAIYIGVTSLTKLADFLRGCEHAIAWLQPQEQDGFLADFREWIYQRFNTKANLSWESVILQHSSSDADAVRQFWVLLDEYLQQRVQRDNGLMASAPRFSNAVENAPATRNQTGD
jgi:hypothetical protein